MDKASSKKTPKAKTSPEQWIAQDQERQALDRAAGRAALAPLAELLCALRLIGLDDRKDRYGSPADGRALARGIDVAFDQGAPSVIVWAGRDGSRMEAKPLASYLAAWLGAMAEPGEPAEHAAFEEVAWKTIETLWKLGEAGCEAAWAKSGASFEPKREKWLKNARPCLGAAEALAWMADGSVDIGVSAKLLLADGSRHNQATRSAMEQIVLAQVAGKPDGPSQASMRL